MQFPRIFGALELSMRASSLRHDVISNNMANVNVPEFAGSEVVFEDRLKQALAGAPQSSGLRGLTPHPMHIPIPTEQGVPVSPEPQVVRLDQQMRQDGNNIDIEDQMAKLAANQLWYQALARSVTDEFGRLRSAITEGRR